MARLGFVASLLLIFGGSLRAQEPLHSRIDKAIQAGHKGPFAERASDADFVRRITLDLTGIIPTAAEVRTFLDDRDPQKRDKLIARLLAGPDFPRRMQEAVHVMLEERREAKESPLPAWEGFLLTSFAENKPFDQLAREILAADDKPSPKNKFYVDRNGEPHLITRDVARLFLGRNIECSQCHDHPVVKDYKQADYFGLYAFLNRGFLTKKGSDTVLAEKVLPGPVEFESVFEMVKMKTGPRLPGGKEVEEPKFAKGEEYVEKPNPKENKPGVPKFSPRSALANELASAKNAMFVRNAANRLWFLMMGRGVVHPLDFHHGDNPPFHPALLDVLADGLVEMKFDVKAYLGEIARSQAYQRSSRLKDETPEGSFAVAELRPLSPEQLFASIARATGTVDLKEENPTKRAQELRTKLGTGLKGFVSAFGSRAGEAEVEFQPSLAGALYLSNDRTILAWLEPKDNNLAARLLKLTNADAMADELYVNILSRPATADERREVAGHLSKRGEQRALAVRELTWALIASTEFRLNH